jgi:hypothetical protein
MFGLLSARNEHMAFAHIWAWIPRDWSDGEHYYVFSESLDTTLLLMAFDPPRILHLNQESRLARLADVPDGWVDIGSQGLCHLTGSLGKDLQGSLGSQWLRKPPWHCFGLAAKIRSTLPCRVSSSGGSGGSVVILGLYRVMAKTPRRSRPGSKPGNARRLFVRAAS